MCSAPWHGFGRLPRSALGRRIGVRSSATQQSSSVLHVIGSGAGGAVEDAEAVGAAVATAVVDGDVVDAEAGGATVATVATLLATGGAVEDLGAPHASAATTMGRDRLGTRMTEG